MSGTNSSESGNPALRIEPNPRWIRGSIGGRNVVDSRASLFVWEHRYYPAWYFPASDVDVEALPSDAVRDIPFDDPELADHVRIEWDALDHWYEEDVEVFVHPRSPEVRVDVLPTSRHVRVSLDGVELASSTRARVLYETGLPPRYYLPQTDVRMELLTPTDSETACPYKGWASYWSVEANGTTHRDLVWGYRTPLPESRDVAGLLCFYNEKVDVEIDGVPESRPKTKFA